MDSAKNCLCFLISTWVSLVYKCPIKVFITLTKCEVNLLTLFRSMISDAYLRTQMLDSKRSLDIMNITLSSDKENANLILE